MLQLPNRPIMVKGEIKGLKKETEYEVHVYEQNKPDEIKSCENLGKRYNPLKPWSDEELHSHWGGWGSDIHPVFFDKSGELESIQTDADGKLTIYQEQFLQNLVGEDMLLGRTVALYEMGDDVRLGCCQIHRDRYR